ncbi:MAG: amidohydrolase family protein [Candidatus Delongbacteria bacterium]|nr:amidohydrolase family protein [Candidatus Delongbacteria bacterium]
MNFDYIISNGLVYDGTLSNPCKSDIGIMNDRISFIGKISEKQSNKIIDAKNMIVTPGFIDIHTHCDLSFKQFTKNIIKDSISNECINNSNFLFQGVTSVITGNCGLGYSNTNNWLDFIKRIDFKSNVYHLVPHGSIREDLFGKNQPFLLSDMELKLLKKRIALEIENGAIGVSLGLEYAPGCFASQSELLEIARTVKKHNCILAVHLRSELGINNEELSILDAIDEVINICKVTGVSLEISHLKLGKPRMGIRIDQVIDKIIKAKNSGLDISFDHYPYEAGNTMLSFLLPNKYKEGSGLKLKYKNKLGRIEIKETLKDLFNHIDPKDIIVSYYPSHPEFESLNLSQIAIEQDIDLLDCYIDMLFEDVIPWAIFFLSDENDIREISKLKDVITVSDGWTVDKKMQNPHPRLYGSFPRKIKKYFIDEKVIDLKSVIRSMTSLPAEKFGIKNRGKIMEGNYADIAIIDLDKLQDKATYLSPHQYSEGVEYLFLNGKLVIKEGCLV